MQVILYFMAKDMTLNHLALVVFISDSFRRAHDMHSKFTSLMCVRPFREMIEQRPIGFPIVPSLAALISDKITPIIEFLLHILGHHWQLIFLPLFMFESARVQSFQKRRRCRP